MVHLPATVDLADLVADPARAAEVPADAIPAVLLQIAGEQSQLAALSATLAARLVAERADDEADRLLTVDQAAEQLATTPDWLRRHPALPFTVRLSAGQVRYSSQGIARFIARRMGARG